MGFEISERSNKIFRHQTFGVHSNLSFGANATSIRLRTIPATKPFLCRNGKEPVVRPSSFVNLENRSGVP